MNAWAFASLGLAITLFLFSSSAHSQACNGHYPPRFSSGERWFELASKYTHDSPRSPGVVGEGRFAENPLHRGTQLVLSTGEILFRLVSEDAKSFLKISAPVEIGDWISIGDVVAFKVVAIEMIPYARQFEPHPADPWIGKWRLRFHIDRENPRNLRESEGDTTTHIPTHQRTIDALFVEGVWKEPAQLSTQTASGHRVRPGDVIEVDPRFTGRGELGLPGYLDFRDFTVVVTGVRPNEVDVALINRQGVVNPSMVPVEHITRVAIMKEDGPALTLGEL